MSDYIFKYQNKNGDLVVLIAHDGNVTFGEGFTTIEESAKEFWYCVGKIQEQLFEGKIKNTDGKATIN